MKKLIGFIGIALIVASCSKKPDTGGTNGESLSNEWWAQLKHNGAALTGFEHIATYNSAADDNHIWVDDMHGLWDFKVKANADFKALTFSVDDAVSVVPNYDIKVSITNGKVILNGGHSKTGNVTDSIYMQIEFEDDPGEIYTIEGHGRTRFSEDDY